MMFSRSLLIASSVLYGVMSTNLARAEQDPALLVWPAELRPLAAELRRVGYSIRFSKPPIPGAYGATDPKKKIIWIAPITQELGILRQSFLHEAVHATQGCPSGRMRPVGWSFNLSPAVDREIAGIMYRNYAHSKYPLEREAFGMQGNPQAVKFIVSELKRRCRP